MLMSPARVKRYLGDNLNKQEPSLDPSWDHLGAIGRLLRAVSRHLGATWGHLGAVRAGAGNRFFFY